MKFKLFFSLWLMLFIHNINFSELQNETVIGEGNLPEVNQFTNEVVEAFPGIKIELKFDQQTYRLNDPIPVMIYVVNNSDAPFTFNVSSLIYESFFFVMRTPKNEETSLLDQFQVEMKDNHSSSGDFRNIVLAPEESFSRVIDVNKWFDIRDAGYYYIKGRFYPNPDVKSQFVESFNYKILIKPPVQIEKKLVEDDQKRIMDIESSTKMPPYDVIEDLLDSKMKKDWQRFLSHVDAERLIASFQEYNNAYQNARSGRYRLEVVEDFKKYLTVHWQDRIMSYKIVESQIKEDKSTVICDVDYKVKLFSYTMRYTFNLYQNHSSQWLVYDYTALKLK